nr:FAD dependent oxidoreductase domain containing protein [Hymenolepis microstoma]
MAVDNLEGSIDNIIRLSSFSCHEEEVSSDTWQNLSLSINNLFANFKEAKVAFDKLPRRTLIRLLVVVYGVVGNFQSSRKLTNLDREIAGLVADEIASSFNTSGCLELMNASIGTDHLEREVIYDLVLQETTRLITHLSNGSDISPLCKGPLFRDALLFTTLSVKYPTLGDSHQLSILHPFCLQLLEDYRINIKQCGLSLLVHLSDQFLLPTWRLSGRAMATLEALAVQRITSGQNMVFLDLVNSCSLKFIGKLEPQDSIIWAEKFMEQLLIDANIEGNQEKRLLLLNSIYNTMEILGKRISVQSKRLIEVIQNALLAPPQPAFKKDTREKEQASHLLSLKILSVFVDLTFDILYPDLIEMVVPPLSVFYELASERIKLISSNLFFESISESIVKVFAKLASPDAESFRVLLKKMSVNFPSLESIACKCTL